MKKIGLFLIVVCLVVGLAGFASAQTESKLRISEVTIWVDSSKETVSDGETIDNVEPGNDIKIEVVVENLYDDRDDEIDDIDIEIVAEELDDDQDDWEEDDSIDDIKGTKDDSVKFEFTVPLDSEVGDHTVTITVTGDGPNASYLHEDDFEFIIEIEKEKHALMISSATFEPETLQCEGSTSLTIKVYNIGEEDEDDVVLEVKNKDLDLELKDTFDIQECPDDDCKYTKTFEIEAAEDQEAGSYPLQIKLTYDEGDETLTKTVTLNTEACIVEVIEEEEEEEEVIVVEEEEEEEEEAIPISEEEAVPALDVEEIAVISLIVLGVVLVVILVIFLVVKATKKD